MRFTTLTTRAVSLAAVCVVSTMPNADPKGSATIVLAGGCFWGTETVFEHLRGVRSVTSGFARYWKVPSPGHVPIEAVRVVYDPSQISYQQLLEVFFTVAHDPTSRDRQGPDAGPQYRAIVFHRNAAQRAEAEAYIDALRTSARYGRPIVTELNAFRSFRPAAGDQQDYVARNPDAPYVVVNDLPKLERLRKEFPRLYVRRN